MESKGRERGSRYKVRERSVFSENLSLLMRETGKRQADVAEAVDKTRQTVSLYANGTSEPGPDTVARLADFFGVSADWLLGRSKIRTVDTDLRSACLTLGVSENALKTLLRMDEISLREDFAGRPSIVKTLDCLLQSPDFYAMLMSFGDYARVLRDDPGQAEYDALVTTFKTVEYKARDIEKQTNGLFRVAAAQDVVDADHAKALRHFEKSLDYVAEHLFAVSTDGAAAIDDAGGA